MLKRLGDPEDGLSYSVRHITVGYASTTTQLPESSLVLAFRNIRVLKTLTWSTWLPITSTILNCLHEAHPTARLVAVALERNDLALDELLLSSPQLHTLNIKLSALYDKNFKKPMGKSEAQHLKSLLMQGSSLKVLKLQFEKIKHGSKAARNRLQCYGPSELDPVSFRFQDEEMMPTLEELTLGGAFNWQHTYGWRREGNSIAEWRAHQDWSAMKKLDLRLDDSDYMLSGLTGSVPFLQSLKIKIPPARVETLCRFLEHVPNLYHFHVESYMDPDSESFHALCSKLPSQLVSLHMDLSSRQLCLPRQFLDLLTRFTFLRVLAYNSYIEQAFGAWPSSPTPLSPSDKFHDLVTGTKVQTHPRPFVKRPHRYGYYACCTSQGHFYGYDIPKPPEWMGYSKDEVDEETKEVFHAFQFCSALAMAFRA